MTEIVGEVGGHEKNVWAQCHCLHKALNATSFCTPRRPCGNIPILFETN